MLVKRLVLVHEGLKSVSIFVWEIDTDKPPVQLVGDHYEFNNQLLEKLMFHNVDHLLNKLTT